MVSQKGIGSVSNDCSISLCQHCITPFPPPSAGATIEGQDLSLFYGNVEKLTTVTESAKFLPNKVYCQLVRDCIVCCVDVVLVRRNDNSKQCLLVERGSEPVKGVWWWPGGRMLKGESFFQAAIRKVQHETGFHKITPIQVLGVWNTFFPTSHWDTPTQKGTQTVNAVVLVELDTTGDAKDDVVLDDTSERWKWIQVNAEQAEANGEDKYVVEALKRLHAWNPHY